MRILHTSDWHLGRSFHRVGMLGHQAAFLDHLLDVVKGERVDIVVVSGDVYDRALPTVETVQLLGDTLARLRDAGAQVLLTSGNHDSAGRLGFGSRVFEQAGVHLRTRLADLDRPVLIGDEHGTVALYGVPYLEPALVANDLGGAARSHEGVLTAAMARIRADLAAQPRGTRSVIAAHAFVVGGLASDSERDITVGGVGSVPASVFAGASYTALGHLHGRQQLTPEVRYSGSPLAYSFSEARQRKGSWLVGLGAGGVQSVDAVDAPVPRPLAALRGDLADLLTSREHADAEAAWCHVTLTDACRPPSAMQQVRSRFPQALVLAFDPQGATSDERSYVQRVRGRDDLDVCCGFLEHVRGGAPASGADRTLLAQALEGSRMQVGVEPSAATQGAA